MSSSENCINNAFPCCRLVDGLVESSYSKKTKALAFAILIIVGLSGVALIGVGVGRICQWGALKVLTGQQGLVLLSLGVFFGPVPLVSGIVGAVKTRQLPSPLGREIWGYYGANIRFDDEYLPDNLLQIMNQDCPFWPGRKVRETHILMRVPREVGANDPLTLNRLEQLLEQSQRGLNIRNFPLRQDIGDQPNNGDRWVLMTREVIPQSLNSPHGDYRLPHPYRLPTAIEAASCIVLEYASSGTQLFNRTATRCNTSFDQVRITVGGWPWRGRNVENGGFNVGHVHDNVENPLLGTAAVRVL